MLTKKLPVVLSTLFLLQACAPTLPNLKRNHAQMPSQYSGVEKNAGAAEETLYKDFFQDKELVALIDVALKNNQELHILEQEINISNNEIMARQGEYLPKFQVGADGGIQQLERFSSEDANAPLRFGRVGVQSTWEIDIWKKLRNATKSAYLDYLASIEGKRFLVTTLVAEVSNTYFELMSLDNQLEIVTRYVDILEQIRGFVQLQQQAGRVTSLPVKRFEAEVLKNQGKKFQLQQKVYVTQNKLNTLLGRYPQEIPRDSKNFPRMILTKVKASVPAKLLDNRPDVKKAALELEASKLNVEVAKARFYPSLSIDASAGYEHFNSRHFEAPVTAGFYSLAANLAAPIINRNAIKADYFSADNRQVQAVYHFEKTLIEAYSDVVNQLNTTKNFDQMYEQKLKQVEALNEAIDVSNTLFKAARVDYVESLLTQRDALEAQIELVEVKQQQLSAYVNLYKSLGGGWRGIE